MRVSQLIEKLQHVQREEGDIEVTCTGTLLEDGHGGVLPDVFESTVENLIVCNHGTIGRRVRLHF